MIKRFTAVTGGSLLALALVVAGAQGCGSDNKAGTGQTGTGGTGGSHTTGGAGTTGSTIQQLCDQACTKVGTCYADAGIPVDDIVATCKSSCTANAEPTNGTTCTNASAIIAAEQACLNKSCDQLQACFDAVPACEGGSTGTGGSTTGAAGHGGSTGAAGHGGSTGAAGAGGSTGAAGTGAAGNPGTGGGSAGAWTCVEASGSCSCAMTTAGGAGTIPACTGSYDCCYTVGSGASISCGCVGSVTSVQCATVATAAGATVVAHCPP
jgi:collagen type VII alpha